ncbi:YtxH domain-containing protein [Actinomyces bowdenii]|uniref:YtxH domain-containing protein n=1 Tax=Actinomyces bowdenii TaxID=131109 RepID=A0A853EJI0_9ACTO|nr:YtxH domain-containing protein [Actinomyces bowdenii]MBF0697334.1 YtxH domain-containing protein [Actinomyces bowdenii]MCR2051415.1 YtxH domain-containing protein [Actinomyces bowdenii]MDO5065184.1 YtxH domain-containing protein [Actinomyces bowdenii]NYS69507.1 YtxH domain-containing protein [Actinomyces bowdenii]
MAGKIPFIIGLGAGYVLGTRAGRAQYERIKATASRVAEQPYVRQKVDAASARVGQAVRAQGEAVTEKVADAVKERLFGSSSRSGAAPASPVQVDDAQVRPLN